MSQTTPPTASWMRFARVWVVALACALCSASAYAHTPATPQDPTAPAQSTDAQAYSQFELIGSRVVWASIEDELDASPWLSNADEFAAWVDETGNRCQRVTTLTAEKLRELDHLLNEHWIGRRAAKVIVIAAGGVAAADPVTGVGVSAAGVVVVIKTSGEWTETLAQQAEDLGDWIESATEPWERYAEAYAAADANPTPDTVAEFMEAAEALRPYLERGERLLRKLDVLAEDIEDKLTEAQDWLEEMDHWSVRWLADNADEHAVAPALAELQTLRPKLQVTQNRLMADQAIVATMPLRFEYLASAE